MNEKVPGALSVSRLNTVQSQTQKRSPGRPPTSNRAAIEKTALTLMLREGYENVSIEAIVAAAGIGRTTLFRFFGSKAGVVWLAFDQTISSLQESLSAANQAEDAHEESPVEAAARAILESTRLAVQSSDMWLRRFELLDTSQELRGGAYDHWERWKGIITNYLSTRSSHSATAPETMAVAGALQAVFVSVLRDATARESGSEKLLRQLAQSLARLTPALDMIISENGTSALP